MNALLQSGVWRIPSESFSDEFDYMIIDPERMRVIFYVVVDVDPINRLSLRYWFRQNRPGIIDSRRAETEWRSFEYVEHGEELFWIHKREMVPWKRMLERDIPFWVAERLIRSHGKMDSEENKSEQCGPDNSRPYGTSVMSPADPASRAGDTPEASGSI